MENLSYTGYGWIYDIYGFLVNKIDIGTETIIRTEPKEMTYTLRNTSKKLPELQPGCVFNYSNAGYGDCSVVPYVVIKVLKKKTGINKDKIYRAYVSQIYSYNKNIVNYIKKDTYSVINIYYNKITEGWNFSPDSTGFCIFGEIKKYEPSICK